MDRMDALYYAADVWKYMFRTVAAIFLVIGRVPPDRIKEQTELDIF